MHFLRPAACRYMKASIIHNMLPAQQPEKQKGACTYMCMYISSAHTTRTHATRAHNACYHANDKYASKSIHINMPMKEIHTYTESQTTSTHAPRAHIACFQRENNKCVNKQ